MTKVAKLTQQQSDEIIGVQYKPDCYFNPIKDANGNWVISAEEVIQCANPDFMWVKSLPLIDYVKAQEPDIWEQ